MKNYSAPNWLLADLEKLEAKVTDLPKDVEHNFDIDKIIDYYSK